MDHNSSDLGIPRDSKKRRKALGAPQSEGINEVQDERAHEMVDAIGKAARAVFDLFSNRLDVASAVHIVRIR